MPDDIAAEKQHWGYSVGENCDLSKLKNKQGFIVLLQITIWSALALNV